MIIKALVLFAALNAGFAWVSPPISKFSVFGVTVPMRLRFPLYARIYDAQAAHLFSVVNVYDLDILFSSHRIARDIKAKNQYRVVAIGDSTTRQSSMWDRLNKTRRTTCNGKILRIYDLGYNGGSVVKDLLILQQAMKYKPDLVVWSFSQSAFLGEPLAFAQGNPVQLDKLATTYDVPMLMRGRSSMDNLISATLVGRRRQLYIQALLNIDYGVLTPALGSNNDAAMTQAVADTAALQTLKPDGHDTGARSQYFLQALAIAHQMAGNTSVILVGEPVNLQDPRIDPLQNAQFNSWIADLSAQHHWTHLALWNLLPPQDFVDAIHRTAAGESKMEQQLMPAILAAACPGH